MTPVFQPASIGDLAQILMLRRTNGTAQSDLATLTADLAAGQASDAVRHLQGHVSPLAAIDADIARNDAFAQTLRQAATRAAQMQAVLSRVEDQSATLSDGLVRAAQSRDPSRIDLAATEARTAFASLISALNMQAGGESLFAGTAVDRPALAGAEEILAAARLAIGGATDPAAIDAALSGWMADPAGFDAAAWRGGDGPVTLSVASGETLVLDATARDPALRSTLRAHILGALLADPGFGGSTEARATLAGRAGLDLLQGAEGRAGMAARLGLSEARLQTLQTRSAAETTALRIARNDMLAIDMPEMAARLEQTESRIQMLYALTARLSRLSLADYL